MTSPPDHSRNPGNREKRTYVTPINGNSVFHFENIRNFRYRSEQDFEESYYDKTFELDSLRSVDITVAAFSKLEGIAHTFLSFGFDNGHLGLSIEAGLSSGQEFSPWKGLIGMYGIKAVWGDEKDLIQLRAIHQKNDVCIYPTKIKGHDLQRMFLDMVVRANSIVRERYNTISNNCLSSFKYNLLNHGTYMVKNSVAFITPLLHSITANILRARFHPRLIAPGHVGKFLYDHQLLDTDLPWEEAKARFNITKDAQQYANDPEFSKRIRQQIEPVKSADSSMLPVFFI